MNIGILNILFALLFSGAATLAYGQQNSSDINQPILPVKGELKPNIKIFHTSEGHKKYSIQILGKWVKGVCEFQGTGKPYALFADLNFDHNLDVWVTGYSNSQGRSRCSDVWLFNPKTKQYKYNSTLSKIRNLEVAPVEMKLVGGMSNCGCAAQCFFHDTYIWQAESLLRIARREQDCGIDNVIYKEFVLVDGKLTIMRQENGIPDDKEYARRQNGDLHFLNWDVKQIN